MLVELRVENLGIISDLLLSLGPGHDGDHGRDRGGKDAHRRRARPAVRRARRRVVGARRRRRGAGRGAVRRRRRGSRARAGHSRRRPHARVHRRASGDGGRARASAGRALVDLHGQHAHQSLLGAGRATRAARPVRGGAGGRARSALLVARGATRRRSTTSWPRSVATTTSRARTIDLLRYELAEIDGGRDRSTTTRRTGSPRRRSCSPTRKRIERRSTTRTSSSKARARRARRGDRGDRRARPLRRDRANGLRALQIETAEAVHDVRIAAEQIVADPERLADGAAAPRAHCASWCASTARRSPSVQAYGDRGARTLGSSIEGHEASSRRARGRAGRAPTGRSPTAAAGCRRRDAPRRRRWRERSQAGLRELAMPAATFEVAVEAGRSGGRRGGRRRRRDLPARPQPGRAGPAARPGGFRWGARTRDACAQRRPLRGAADPRLRRGGRRHRGRGRHGRRPCAGDIGREAPGVVCDAPRSGRRLRRRAGRGRRRPRQEGARSRAPSCCSKRPGSVRSRGCWRASASRRTRARHAGELLANAHDARTRREGAPARVRRADEVPTKRAHVRRDPRHRQGRPPHEGSHPPPRTPATSRSSIMPTSIASRPTRWSRRASSAVVNASPSISGRYPNGGPIRIVQRGDPAARRGRAGDHGSGP